MNAEIIVVGGGHAGCEAALASARIGKKTLLITSNIKNIADTPCNPSIGGSAKGTVVREIDALGGEMAKNTDKSLLQLKYLNTKKGPAVRALRGQIDKVEYKKNMLETLKNQENLSIRECMIEDLLIENKTCKGVIDEKGEVIKGEKVILTTGTYLKANVLIGAKNIPSGPSGEKRSNSLSDKLKELGFTIKRLKTGTPPRLSRDSINFEETMVQEGDKKKLSFSFNKKATYDVYKQIPCYLTYTNETCHDLINKHLNESSMYGGYVEGVGPRYCPSIEDKVVRFKERDRHQLFLEPESIHYDDIYVQGLSTSLPEYVQEMLVKSIKGLENAVIKKYAYAIEYDAIDSRQLYLSLETRLIKNLYTAGQINGTSGYEEAACQGLIAGINASLALDNKEPIILKRSDAYIGVLIDDLVTKGVIDPYRLLTSRSEYRLILRSDNADLRLTEIGRSVGLVTDEDYQRFLDKKKKIEEITIFLKENRMKPSAESDAFLDSNNSSRLNSGISLFDLLKRPEIKIRDLFTLYNIEADDEIIDEIETNIKYEGYIKKEAREIEKMLALEKKQIPVNFDYQKVPNLASEARQKLDEVRPENLGQALRISGVNPADINILSFYLKRGHHE